MNRIKSSLSGFLLCLGLSLPGFSVFSGNYYWVGNSGNWDDAAHWSATSGGIGGSGIPTLTDNVIFDHNSIWGKEAQISIKGPAQCNTFDASGLTQAVVFNGSDEEELLIASSFLLNANCHFEFPGKVRFVSSGNKVISTGGVELKCDLEFSGNRAEWKLLSALRMNNAT
ncbi:MAG: hypothetical protein ACE5DN_02905, partial [Flavobacteriales bacterium]